MSASVRSMSLTVCRAATVAYRAFNPATRSLSTGACLRTESNPAEGSRGFIESTEEFRFVERLVPPSRIPTPPKHEGPAPSGWIPPSATPPSLPYMIRRSRMHNVPVYSDIKHGNQHSTLLRKIEGDIWALNKDVKEFLLGLTGKEPPTQVNEITGTIRIKGLFDKELKDRLLKKGF
ncbi:39S ribosomal protein L49, mitochondrial-like [Sinocyclocheilus anshuiensis]|uniref:39S ribosomal protein L49, mitochondrial-like n=1 Tax=Sinocyclocheilus anshuiensis TaxID=1608454 RepID=UPI0007B93371|nr:PREDICTED: 39S ribosomal protein L49, mitochondrial-like [Sinocyclocheilus anshuiensis]